MLSKAIRCTDHEQGLERAEIVSPRSFRLDKVEARLQVRIGPCFAQQSETLLRLRSNSIRSLACSLIDSHTPRSLSRAEHRQP